MDVIRKSVILSSSVTAAGAEDHILSRNPETDNVLWGCKARDIFLTQLQYQQNAEPEWLKPLICLSWFPMMVAMDARSRQRAESLEPQLFRVLASGSPQGRRTGTPHGVPEQTGQGLLHCWSLAIGHRPSL